MAAEALIEASEWEVTKSIDRQDCGNNEKWEVLNSLPEEELLVLFFVYLRPGKDEMAIVFESRISELIMPRAACSIIGSTEEKIRR